MVRSTLAHRNPARRASHRQIRFAPRILSALRAGELRFTIAATLRTSTVRALQVQLPPSRSKLGETTRESAIVDHVVGHLLPGLLTAYPTTVRRLQANRLHPRCPFLVVVPTR